MTSIMILILQAAILTLLVLNKGKKTIDLPKVNRRLDVKKAIIPTSNLQKRKPIYNNDSVLYNKEQKILRGE